MRCQMRSFLARKAGFTLIELLIVVAIISILASIAVPNFLEAQIRARAARAQAEMQVLELGIESYMVDNDSYPVSCVMSTTGTAHMNFDKPLSRRLIPITTPISYLSSLPKDIFPPMAGWNGKNPTSDLEFRHV